jgi:hypothetical protein
MTAFPNLAAPFGHLNGSREKGPAHSESVCYQVKWEDFDYSQYCHIQVLDWLSLEGQASNIHPISKTLQKHLTFIQKSRYL